MADHRSALALAQSGIFDAASARETARLRAQRDAAPGPSWLVRWTAVYVAAWTALQILMVLIGLIAHPHVPRRLIELLIVVCVNVRFSLRSI